MSQIRTDDCFVKFFDILSKINLKYSIADVSLSNNTSSLHFDVNFISQRLHEEKISKQGQYRVITRTKKTLKPTKETKKIKKQACWQQNYNEILVKVTKDYKCDWKKIHIRINRLLGLNKPLSYLKNKYKIAIGASEERITKFFEAEEDKYIENMILERGFVWDVIAEKLNRSPGSVKNRYYFLQRKIKKEE